MPALSWWPQEVPKLRSHIPDKHVSTPDDSQPPGILGVAAKAGVPVPKIASGSVRSQSSFWGLLAARSLCLLSA